MPVHPSETGSSNPETREATPAPIPQEVAKRFINDTLVEHARPIGETRDHSTLHLCFSREETLPGVGPVALNVIYRHYEQPTPANPEQMRFEYAQASAEHEDKPASVADMHLAIASPDRFVLEHRYVYPPFRTRSGIGSRLLTQAEQWLQQVAQERGGTVTIELQAGQPSMFDWIQKQGYAVQDDQRETLQEISEHPERFFEDRVILSSESEQDRIVKDPYLFRQGTNGRYMEDAVRLTFRKQISGSTK